jgi:hypothetical protein
MLVDIESLRITTEHHQFRQFCSNGACAYDWAESRAIASMYNGGPFSGADSGADPINDRFLPSGHTSGYAPVRLCLDGIATPVGILGQQRLPTRTHVAR